MQTSNDAALQVEDVSVQYNSPWFRTRGRTASPLVLDGVSLTVRHGEIVGLLGPNGSGKTTLMKVIATTLIPIAGRVLVGGHDAIAHPEYVRKQVAFCVANERSFYPRLTARENLDFFASLEEVPRNERRARIDEVLVMTGMDQHPDKMAMEFSTGMFQKLGFARALLKRPKLLLADEPTRSLDPAASETLWQLMRSVASQGTTVLLATHDFTEAVEVANRITVLRRGKLLVDQVHDRRTVEELRDFYFDNVATASGDEA